MKILVTGGAGFIGSHLSEKLNKEGHNVTVLDSLSSFLYPREFKERNLKNLLANGVKFVQADLAHSELETIVQSQDVVVNQAAVPGLVKSWSHFSDYNQSNVIGLARLIETCVRLEVPKFIQISTSSVYGINATGNEDSVKAPASPYGVTKLAAENLAKAYEQSFKLDLSILRYFSVYGPRQRPDMAYFKFIEAIMNGDPIQIYGDGTQSRTNTYVGDIVEATQLSIKLDSCPEEKIFNIAGNQSISVIEAVRILESIIGKRAILNYVPKVPGDQHQTNGDTRRARSCLKWAPIISLQEGLEQQVRWQKTFRND